MVCWQFDGLRPLEGGVAAVLYVTHRYTIVLKQSVSFLPRVVPPLSSHLQRLKVLNDGWRRLTWPTSKGGRRIIGNNPCAKTNPVRPLQGRTSNGICVAFQLSTPQGVLALLSALHCKWGWRVFVGRGTRGWFCQQCWSLVARKPSRLLALNSTQVSSNPR